jgi:hypothetical protein
MKCCGNCQNYGSCNKKNNCCCDCAFYENGGCTYSSIEKEGENFGFFSELLEIIFKK